MNLKNSRKRQERKGGGREIFQRTSQPDGKKR